MLHRKKPALNNSQLVHPCPPMHRITYAISESTSEFHHLWLFCAAVTTIVQDSQSLPPCSTLLRLGLPHHQHFPKISGFQPGTFKRQLSIPFQHVHLYACPCIQLSHHSSTNQTLSTAQSNGRRNVPGRSPLEKRKTTAFAAIMVTMTVLDTRDGSQDERVIPPGRRDDVRMSALYRRRTPH